MKEETVKQAQRERPVQPEVRTAIQKIWQWCKNVIMWRGYVYRFVMRIAHKFNWHYAPPIYPDGDTHLWCKWCGFSQTVKRKNDVDILKSLTNGTSCEFTCKCGKRKGWITENRKTSPCPECGRVYVGYYDSKNLTIAGKEI